MGKKDYRFSVNKDVTKKDAIRTILLGTIIMIGTAGLATIAIPWALQQGGFVRKVCGTAPLGGVLIVVFLFNFAIGLSYLCLGVSTIRRLNRKK